MKYSRTSKGRVLPVAIQILTIFGVVEQRQLRLLFDFLSDNNFGKILSLLKREGFIFISPDGKFIASSRYTMVHKKPLESVMTFWAFIYLRDRITDFCASDPPSILTFTASGRDYDLIPGSDENLPAINEQAYSVPDETVRLIVTKTLDIREQVEARKENDYLVLVGQDGVQQFYRLKKGERDGQS